jgi:GntR family transcriptional regulator
MIELQLDKRSPVPFYRQIVDMVLAGIAAGTIAPGEKLPTIRELAVRMEVNPNTIAKAYSQLQLLGALDNQQGTGVFVRPQTRALFSAADKEQALEALCHDFVGRAQLLGLNVRDLIDYLERLQVSS